METTGRTTPKPVKGGVIRDFTSGPLLREMIFFAIPFMLSNAMQVLYSLTDMVVVGHYVGSRGLSAVTIASQASMFLVMLCLGLSTGGQVYISQLIGAGGRDRLNRTIGTLFTVILTLGAVMTGVSLLTAKPFLRLLSTPPEAYSEALDYLYVCGAGLLFAYGYNLVSAILRGLGDSRHPFLFIAVATAVNVVLDLVFVAGFGWGVFGAGLATVIGQGVSFLYALFFLYRRREAFGFDFRRSSFRIDPAILRGQLKLGIPFAIQSCAINLSMLYVTGMINVIGYQASAVFGVGVKLDDLVNKVSQGMTFAVSGVVGQNTGARKFDRVRRGVYFSWGLCGVLFAIYTVVLVTCPREMFSLFTDDAAVLALSGVFVAAIVWQFPALMIMKGTQGFIQGIGNANLSLVLALLDGFAFRILLCWVLGIGLDMGLYGFLLGFALATYGTAIPGLLYFLFWPWWKRPLAIS